MAGYVSEDDETGDDRTAITGKQFLGNHAEELVKTVPDRKTETKFMPDDASPCIMKYKSVFKCKICPRTVCLNEDTMRAHLKSKVMLACFLSLQQSNNILLFVAEYIT